MSNDSDPRIIFAKYTTLASTSVAGAGTATYLSWNTKVKDTHNMCSGGGAHVTTTNTGFKCIAPSTDCYDFTASTGFTSASGFNGTTERARFQLFVNGANVQEMARTVPATTDTVLAMYGVASQCLNAGDRVEVAFSQDSGTDQTLDSTVTTYAFTMRKVGGASSFAMSEFTPPTVSRAYTAGTASGTGGFVSGTYTTPANVKYLIVTVQGGGGGGGGGGTSSVAATSGGSSTFGGITVTGGAFGVGGGGAAGSNIGGLGGTVTAAIGSGAGSYTGNPGEAGLPNPSSVVIRGGNGGASAAMGAGQAINGTTSGSAIATSGSGGAGGGTTASSATSGGGGGAGARLRTIITSPAATYSYSVGAGGNAGTSGGNGYTGGAGAIGEIVVEEYYK